MADGTKQIEWEPSCHTMKMALNIDTLAHIMSFLDFEDRDAARLTCRLWNEAGRVADMRAVGRLAEARSLSINYAGQQAIVSCALLCGDKLVLCETQAAHRTEYTLYSASGSQRQPLGRNTIVPVSHNRKHACLKRYDVPSNRPEEHTSYLFICVHEDSTFHLLRTAERSVYTGAAVIDSGTVAQIHRGWMYAPRCSLPWETETWGRLLTLEQAKRKSRCTFRKDCEYRKIDLEGALGNHGLLEYRGERLLLIMKREGLVLLDLEHGVNYTYAFSPPNHNIFRGRENCAFSDAVVHEGEGKFRHVLSMDDHNQRGSNTHRVCTFTLKRPWQRQRPEAVESIISATLLGSQNLCFGRFNHEVDPREICVDVLSPDDSSVLCSFPIMLPFTPRGRFRKPNQFGLFRLTNEHYVISDLEGGRSMLADCRRKRYRAIDGAVLCCSRTGIIVGGRDGSAVHHSLY